MTVAVNTDRLMREAHIIVALRAARDAITAGSINEAKLHLDAAIDFMTQETVVNVAKAE